MIVDILKPTENDKIIDPACGSGGFLIETLKFVWLNMDEKYQKLGWKYHEIEKEKIDVATKNFRGIDKDYFLSKVAKAYMNLVGDGTTGIFCEDSLEEPKNWNPETKLKIQLESFDLVLTNPPFGKEIKVVGKDKLQQFDLAYEWKKTNDNFVRTNKIKDDVQPQILFIERCFQLLKKGGKLGIILPETFFHAPKLYYILDFFKKHNVLWVIDLPHNTFRPLCNAKCCVLIIQKGMPQQEKINMGVAVEMGHDHNGKPMYRWDYKTQTINKNEIWDDIDLIINEIENSDIEKQYTFGVNSSTAFNQKVLVPRYFWNSREKEIEQAELRLPIQNDKATRERIGGKIESVFDKKWDAQKTILEIKQELGNLTT
jgi:type I restriction enzyme M protein